MLPNPVTNPEAKPAAAPPPLVHHPDYTVRPWPAGHRFPMPKFALLRDRLLGEGVAKPEQFHAPDGPAPDALLELAHERDYIQAFTQGRLDPDHQRRIGLPWSPDLVRRTKTAVAGTVLACELALEHGLATQCAGGTHHAHRDYGSGFCIFNDLAVAAAHLVQHHHLNRVLIVDLDVHQGDGTARIFESEAQVFTFSVHADKNFPLRKAQSDLDVALPDGVNDDAYLALLQHGATTLPGAVCADHQGVPTSFDGLAALLDQAEPQFVLYDAGVDVHRDDRLGKLELTDDGLYRRDRFVIDAVRARNVPLACVIGGGYAVDPADVARRHAVVHRAAADHHAHRNPNP
ncbi:MAG: histone deacetylase [Planctomycetota bacterium]